MGKAKGALPRTSLFLCRLYSVKGPSSLAPVLCLSRGLLRRNFAQNPLAWATAEVSGRKVGFDGAYSMAHGDC